ncbi:sulfatase-like hydrolase/transferase [Hungatella sp.]|uniref:LTA synthase family protein n=1 Tax=Hungatella sp. TaxID=2613924 RepID=UPI002A7EABEF|nr:sulfatase-like hydrolase/transferase [Hungatella sp.]
MKKNIIKINFKYAVAIIIMITSVILYFCGSTMIKKSINYLYPERIIDMNEIREKSAYLNDFVIEEKGIISLSDNPWLYLDCKDWSITKPYSISIFINSLSKEKESIELYNLNSYDGVFGEIKPGKNNFILAHGSTKCVGIRVDLATTYDTKLYIDKIIVNDTNYLYSLMLQLLIKICILVSVMVIAFILFLIAYKSRKIIILDKLIAFITNLVGPHNISTFIEFIYIYISCFFLYKGNILPAIIGLIFYCIIISYYNKKNVVEYQNKYIYVGANILKLFLLILIFNNLVYTIFTDIRSHNVVCFFLLFIIINLEYNLFCTNKNLYKLSLGLNFYIIGLLYILAELFITYLNMPTEFVWNLSYIISQINDTIIINLIFVFIISIVIKALLGKYLSYAILSIVYTTVVIGNYIKITYQNTLFKPIDFLVIKDLFSILNKYIGQAGILFLTLCLFLVICIILWSRKLWKKCVQIHCDWKLSVLVIPLFILFLLGLKINLYSDIGISNNLPWWKAIYVEKSQGLALYNYYNIMSMKNIIPQKPEGYSAQAIDNILHENKKLLSANSDEPTVIVIMAESIFDVEAVPSLEFSPTITENIKKYQISNIISPRFGGGTAGVEFEALTGMTNFFFLEDTIYYTTYVSDNKNIIPSLAYEFNKNGYKTYAIHPNDKDFYNRQVVYKNMGFDTFMGIEDFPHANQYVLNDGYINDNGFFHVIKDILAENERPQFIWGVTIAGHLNTL